MILEGPNIVQNAIDKVNIVKEKLKAVQECQKSYVGQHKREIKYQVGKMYFYKCRH